MKVRDSHRAIHYRLNNQWGEKTDAGMGLRLLGRAQPDAVELAPPYLKQMAQESKLPIIFDFVKKNPNMTATQISQLTGIDALTVHRHLTGGRGKINDGLFIREKVTGQRVDPGGRIRGTFHFIYSINPNPKPESKSLVNKKRGFKHGQLNNFIFGRSV